MNKENFGDILKKVEEMKKTGNVDLSTEEDLSIAVMNLVSLEEHFFFTAEKTGKPEYFEFQKKVREMRKELLGKMIQKTEGEAWCIAKHLLATSMRLIEVGTKLNADGDHAAAKEMFDKAYETYSMFWAIRLRIVDATGFKEAAKEEKPWTMKDIVEKLVNCCDE